MNLPEAPIVQGGFFATHLFIVKDQEKSEVGQYTPLAIDHFKNEISSVSPNHGTIRRQIGAVR